MVRQIRNLLYEQGFTISGARLQLSGDSARQDASQSHQIILQLRHELEQLLALLK
jgi:hypothetical protein